MKLYTKTGDRGQTAIIGGAKLSKSSERVEAYGTIDELNSLLGYSISQMDCYNELKKELQNIQQILFDCGTDMATPNDSKGFRMDKEATTWLEGKIDRYADVPPKLTEFIIPGGCPLASLFHVVRTVVRRAERTVVCVREVDNINDNVLIFLNRLSDYMYVIARYVNFREGRKEVSYKRNKQVFF